MNLWKRWTAYCAMGELLGIACAGALAYLVNIWIGEPIRSIEKAGVLAAMSFAGFLEGYILSTMQWKILVEKFPRIKKSAWRFYTVLIAVIGWFFGMLPSLFMATESSPEAASANVINFDNPIVFAALSIGLGLLLGACFGFFQWIVLRKHAHKASRWIVANALGWGLGLGWIYVFASIPTEESSILFIVLVGIVGGALAGLSVGAITGLFLVRMKVRHAD